MNATEPRFLNANVRNAAPGFVNGASVGVIGWVNERIDIALLEKICALPEVRSLTNSGHNFFVHRNWDGGASK